MSEATARRIGQFRGKRILVLGDVMLDRFVYGRVQRISPEAPIPVLTVEREACAPGGAGNVARNIAALGGEAILIGLIGADGSGERLQGLLVQEPGIVPDLVAASLRPTICKTRFVAGHQQILRADEESAAPAGEAAPALLDRFLAHLPEADAVVISDYAKGVLCPAVLAPAIAAARAASKPVIVDPKGGDFHRYDGADLVKPNAREAAQATGIVGEDDRSVAAAADAILAAAPAIKAVLVTRGARGISFTVRGNACRHIAGTPREVFDVSGAGDTVAAVLALGAASGVDLADAAGIANIAAGLAVSSAGVAAVSADVLIGEVRAQSVRRSEAKIVSREQAVAQVERWRAHGARIGFTNGCFDLIHPGHVSLLAQARAACDRLIVGLNADASVKRLKGESRPVQDETARAVVLSSLASVDLVVAFAEDTPKALVEALAPDVLVKGADYRDKLVVGADFVTARGGSVLLVDLVAGQSTTETIRRMGDG